MLPPDVLARRSALPVKPAAVELAGELVTMRPLDLDLDGDVAALHAVSSGAPFALGARSVGAYDPDELVWRYMFGGPFADRRRAARRGSPARTPRPTAGRSPCAIARPARRSASRIYIANQPQHLKIELGSIWYGPIAQRTGASREVTRLMLAHVFALGYRRAEWKCDARNARSRARGAVVRLSRSRASRTRTTSSRAATATPRGSACSITSGRRPRRRGDDVAQVQEVDREVRRDRTAEVAGPLREHAERDAEHERRCRPRQEPPARPDVQHREHRAPAPTRRATAAARRGTAAPRRSSSRARGSRSRGRSAARAGRESSRGGRAPTRKCRVATRVSPTTPSPSAGADRRTDRELPRRGRAAEPVQIRVTAPGRDHERDDAPSRRTARSPGSPATAAAAGSARTT